MHGTIQYITGMCFTISRIEIWIISNITPFIMFINMDPLILAYTSTSTELMSGTN